MEKGEWGQQLEGNAGLVDPNGHDAMQRIETTVTKQYDALQASRFACPIERACISLRQDAPTPRGCPLHREEYHAEKTDPNQRCHG